MENSATRPINQNKKFQKESKERLASRPDKPVCKLAIPIIFVSLEPDWVRQTQNPFGDGKPPDLIDIDPETHLWPLTSPPEHPISGQGRIDKGEKGQGLNFAWTGKLRGRGRCDGCGIEWRQNPLHLLISINQAIVSWNSRRARSKEFFKSAREFWWDYGNLSSLSFLSQN